MDETDRVHAYEAQAPGRPLTPAQLRRIKHKRGHQLRAEIRRDSRPVVNLRPLGVTRLWFTPDGGSSVELTDMVREVRVDRQITVGLTGLQKRVPISARNVRRLLRKKGAQDREW